MSEDNKALVRKFIETLNRHDLDGLDELIASDVVWHGGSFGEIEGREAFKGLVGGFLTAFPDLRVELNGLVAEGDLVATRFTTTGTQAGEILGVPSTGKTATWGEQPIYRFSRGSVSEVWWTGMPSGCCSSSVPYPAARAFFLLFTTRRSGPRSHARSRPCRSVLRRTRGTG